MDYQCATVEGNQQVFGAPGYGNDGLAGQGLFQLPCHRPAQVAVVDLQAADAVVCEMWGYPAAGGFNFR